MEQTTASVTAVMSGHVEHGVQMFNMSDHRSLQWWTRIVSRTAYKASAFRFLCATRYTQKLILFTNTTI